MKVDWLKVICTFLIGTMFLFLLAYLNGCRPLRYADGTRVVSGGDGVTEKGMALPEQTQK